MGSKPRRARSTRVGLATVFCLLATSGVSCAQDALRFSRQPYLQQLQPRTVLLVWRTSVPADATVEIGAERPDERTFSDDEALGTHVIAISELEPDTEYTYRALSKLPPGAEPPPEGPTQIISEVFTFRTPPEDTAKPVLIAVFGDAGAGTPAQLAVRDIVEELDPHVLLVTGDLVYPSGADETYQARFFDVYTELFTKTCVYPAIGNHDSIDSGDSYLTQFVLPSNGSPENQGRYYSFDIGACHFVSIDTNGAIEEDLEQLEWLRRDLANTDRPWKIAYFHHPLFTTGPHTTDREKLPRRDALMPIFDEFGVDVALAGHDHFYERTYPIRDGVVRDGWHGNAYRSPRGTIYVVTGGGGQTLYPRVSSDDLRYAADFAQIHHTVGIRVTENALFMRAHVVDGIDRDILAIHKTLTRPTLRFLRGDTNFDETFTISDAIRLLEHLFLGRSIDCPISGDWNGDRDIDITDAINSLAFQFLGGAPPAEPYPDCGPADDDLDGFCVVNPCPD